MENMLTDTNINQHEITNQIKTPLEKLEEIRLKNSNTSETDLPTKTRVKKKVVKTRSRSRAFQISVSSETYQYAVVVLAKVSGVSHSEMIRTLLDPYIKFCYEEILKRDGFMDEYNVITVKPEEMLEYYLNHLDDPKEYLNRFGEYTERTGLKFPFLKPSNMLQ